MSKERGFCRDCLHFLSDPVSLDREILREIEPDREGGLYGKCSAGGRDIGKLSAGQCSEKNEQGDYFFEEWK